MEEYVMDIRSSEAMEPIVEHFGTCPVWWFYKEKELKEATMGGFVELISEFEIKPGARLDPHSHHTLEFYYVISGRGIMTISGEERQVCPGDLITIPPDAVHSIRPLGHVPIRSLAVGIGLKD
jgi:mannose-6-phosphate isomerase-like protein (cupin superfamily)